MQYICKQGRLLGQQKRRSASSHKDLMRGAYKDFRRTVSKLDQSKVDG